MQEKTLKGKRCLITGANSGIGLATAIAIAQKGAEVIIVCRNLAKANVAKEQIINKSGNKKVALLLADFADQASIRRMAEQFHQEYGQLDILINNAGLIASNREETADGYEYTFAVNHLGYFMTTCLLMPALQAAPSARIVSVSSEAHRIGEINFDDIQLRRGYTNMKAYAQSKLANILFTDTLAKKLKDTNITANCLHPGVVKTNFAGEGDLLMKGMFLLARPFMISATEGAQTSIYLASSPEVEGVTGKYFAKCKKKRPATRATNPDTAEQLWKLSESMTGVVLGISA